MSRLYPDLLGHSSLSEMTAAMNTLTNQLNAQLIAPINQAIIQGMTTSANDDDDFEEEPMYIDTTRLAELTELERKLCQKYIKVLLRRANEEYDSAHTLARRNLVALQVLVVEDVYLRRRKLKALVADDTTNIH